MTLSEYLENPMGKGDASLPNKATIIQTLKSKYDKLMERKGDKIKLTLYRHGITGEFYAHLIIPSETERDNTYDVVFRFFDANRSHTKDLSIRNYDIQMFTNTPSFAYTFFYVYRQYGMVIPMFEGKFGKEFLTMAPTIRNRFEIVNFDKYLYFGARYLLDSKWILNRAYLDTHCRNLNQKKLVASVRSLKKIMEEYDTAKAELQKHKKYQKAQKSRKTSTIKTPGVDVGVKRPIKPTAMREVTQARVKPKKTLMRKVVKK